jgi:hypothetical protein
MDYSQFLYMKEELSLIAVIVLLLLFDLLAGEKGRKILFIDSLFATWRSHADKSDPLCTG